MKKIFYSLIFAFCCFSKMAVSADDTIESYHYNVSVENLLDYSLLVYSAYPVADWRSLSRGAQLAYNYSSAQLVKPLESVNIAVPPGHELVFYKYSGAYEKRNILTFAASILDGVYQDVDKPSWPGSRISVDKNTVLRVSKIYNDDFEVESVGEFEVYEANEYVYNGT